MKENKLNLDVKFIDYVKLTLSLFLNAANNLCKFNKKQLVWDKTLSKISEDEAIKVCKLDKGNGVCIINASDYYQKLDVIVDDKFMFRKVLFVLTTKNISTCTKSLLSERCKQFKVLR